MSVLPNLNSIKVGLRILWNGEPYLVVTSNFVRMQQRKPVMQTKLKNLITGKVLEYSFHPGDNVEEADLERTKASFLYKTENEACFMDSSSYEQFSLELSTVADKVKYLKEGDEVEVLKFENRPISLEIQKKLTLKVISAPPGVKGDTAGGNVTKEAELENGLMARVPLFINEGDSVVINTDTGDYVERAK
jgi:elongation factor P